MHLKISSSVWVVFEWDVKEVLLPTVEGYIGILPWHIPLTTILVPGLLKFLPSNPATNTFIQSSQFLYENDFVAISVSDGIAFVDGKEVKVTISLANTIVEESTEILLKMKTDLERQIQDIKQNWSIEELEKLMIDLQKINADIKLQKLQ